MADSVPVSQLTPYTCVLACLESVLHDFGLSASQADMLAHHRDICLNPHSIGTHGAIDENRLKILASRYLVHAEDYSFTDEQSLNLELQDSSRAIIACCHRYRAQDNLNHCIRLLAVDTGNVTAISPAFPCGLIESLALADMVSSWMPNFIRLRRQ